LYKILTVRGRGMAMGVALPYPFRRKGGFGRIPPFEILT